MGLINTIKMHAAISSGNFGKMFKDAKLPVLPQAVSRVLDEVNREEPDVTVLENIIAAEPEFSVKVVSTVNSSLFALRAKVTGVRHAITLLGFDRIRSVILSYSMLEALPKPGGDLFVHEAYWTDTLLRSLLAQSIARRVRPGEEEEAFTSMLVADVAVPVLLTTWRDYYEPILKNWRSGQHNLARLERDAYGWDHAQASAWILQKWDFPEKLVCLVGAHTLTRDEIKEYGMDDSVADCLAVASQLPSSLARDHSRCDRMIELAGHALALPQDAWPGIYDEVRQNFEAVYAQFSLTSSHALGTLDGLAYAIRKLGQEICV
ncbi:HDOD domain-containing protein [bacterium]|nr:HDOD domain-containing protein [bacterium]MBU1072887.1 HDOD domain-containing protein [bacterium]MBU1675904.1 HDOD domain-containing protein [bacterium]